MHVCMKACMHACMYVCMYVSMYVRMEAFSMYVCIHVYDCAFPDVPHYALKWIINTPANVISTSIIPYEVQFFFDISFKNAL